MTDPDRGRAACGIAPANAPVVRLTVVGSGEALLRMEKRLHCAAAGAGVALELAIRKDAEALGIPFERTPVVLRAGQVVLDGLLRTEAIEAWLRQAAHAEKPGDVRRP